MKIIINSNGRRILKISKTEWENIGRVAAWIDKPSDTTLTMGEEQIHYIRGTPSSYSRYIPILVGNRQIATIGTPSAESKELIPKNKYYADFNQNSIPYTLLENIKWYEVNGQGKDRFATKEEAFSELKQWWPIISKELRKTKKTDMKSKRQDPEFNPEESNVSEERAIEQENEKYFEGRF